MTRETILPRHRRVEHPPRMQLTERDVQVVLAVFAQRVLSREQITRLFFRSKNTANERLMRLYQHGFLERRWLPVAYGHGMGQALYLLGKRGADIVAHQRGIDHQAIGWQASLNHVGSPFLEHSLMINDVRIAVTLAACRPGYGVEAWVGEDELKATPDYVSITTSSGRQRRVAVIPDSYFVLRLGDRRAHFFLEADRATVSNTRWRDRIRAYRVYTESGRYTERYGTHSLRVLTVTTGPQRLANLKRTTEDVGGGQLFWFTTAGEAMAEDVLARPLWRVAGRDERACLVECIDR
jgi:hypothetical protein